MSEKLIRCPVYAVGPMSGREGHNFAWWAEVSAWCDARGYFLRDARRHCRAWPVELANEPLPREAYMRASLEDVMRAQSIILHPEWSLSAGAFMEWLTAYELALDMYLWPSMDLWPRADQDHVAKLLRHALSAIVYARDNGSGKHGVDSYTHEPLSHHTRKVETHAADARDELDGTILRNGEDHIALALCRAAMALEVRKGSGSRCQGTE